MAGAQGAHKVSKSNSDQTLNFVLDEIEALSEKSPEGFTVSQMSFVTGHGVYWCRKKLKSLIESGKAVCNGMAKKTTIDGRVCFVPVYLIKK